jgi:hypothetical protein
MRHVFEYRNALTLFLGKLMSVEENGAIVKAWRTLLLTR